MSKLNSQEAFGTSGVVTYQQLGGVAVEGMPGYGKSTESSYNGDCVAGREVLVDGTVVAVEVADTKHRDGQPLSAGVGAWRTFIGGVCAGEFDRPA
jgi:hypothetical protein